MDFGKFKFRLSIGPKLHMYKDNQEILTLNEEETKAFTQWLAEQQKW